MPSVLPAIPTSLGRHTADTPKSKRLDTDADSYVLVGSRFDGFMVGDALGLYHRAFGYGLREVPRLGGDDVT